MLFFRYMSDFSRRLQSEIEYIGLNRKEFAAKAGIKKRALDAYLGAQQSMPPADTAVKIASALGVSVEYLVTGREYRKSIDISSYLQFRDILDDLAVLPEEILEPIKAVIKTFADSARRKNQAGKGSGRLSVM
jgi:transcriptional regulator with XRE-family HTH domain